MEFSLRICLINMEFHSAIIKIQVKKGISLLIVIIVNAVSLWKSFIQSQFSKSKNKNFMKFFYKYYFLHLQEIYGTSKSPC